LGKIGSGPELRIYEKELSIKKPESIRVRNSGPDPTNEKKVKSRIKVETVKPFLKENSAIVGAVN